MQCVVRFLVDDLLWLFEFGLASSRRVFIITVVPVSFIQQNMLMLFLYSLYIFSTFDFWFFFLNATP